TSDSGGFFFPSSIKKKIYIEFIPQAIDAVWSLYFKSAPNLSRQARLDFMMIFYVLLELKLLEVSQARTVCLSCKDGIDLSGSFSSFLFAFIKLHNQSQMTEAEQEYLNLMLYGPLLLVRDRSMLFNDFNRFASALKVIESLREEM